MLWWLFRWEIPISLSSKTIAGFLKLVELWKRLLVFPCLVSSVEMNGTSRLLGKWVAWLVGKGYNLCRVKIGILAVFAVMSSSGLSND
jgi:hypothetical protein